MADQTLSNSFQGYFESWIIEQNQHLRELTTSLKDLEETRNRNTSQDDAAAAVHPLVDRVLNHYAEYYEVKSRWARNDVLTMFHPSWRSNLEMAFSWIGGWRPTMAFQLLHSRFGVQLNGANDLQQETVKDEKEISEKYAKLQESVASASMVHLSHVATQAKEAGLVINDGRIIENLLRREVTLVELLKEADNLRLKTLKQVLSILTPIQRIHFLIAAAELHLRFHEWGKARDDAMLVHHQQDGHN